VRTGKSSVDRRGIVKGALAGSLAAVLGSAEQGGAAAPDAERASGLIERENRRPGAKDWQLTRVRLDRSGCRSPWIEGYCSHQSIAAGQTLEIMVSTNPARSFVIDVYRMGYYGGAGARHMTRLGPFTGRVQPDPPTGPRRRRECRWEPAAQLTIPADWPSGVYLGRLTTQPETSAELYWQSFLVFIVRDDRPADLLFQCSDNTWQAYNRWPDRFSLYDDGSEREWTSGPGWDVSFDRPYGKYRQILDYPQSVGSGEFLLWEFPLCYWLEQHGYDVSYCSNSDLLNPSRGLKCKAFLSVGHDEYWDLRQYQSVKTMMEGGVSALFLSANSICWVSPLSAGDAGRPNRLLTRAAPYGGYAGHQPENGVPFGETGPDEGLLMGGRNVNPVNGGGDWTVARPEHWIFEGTGMKKGDAVPGLVGWEYHGNPAPLPGLEIVAEGTALQGGQRPQRWTATVHPGSKENFVFNAATIFWAQGLSSPPGHVLPWSHWSRPHGPDERVQRITHNLLRRATR
jgi:N,N-dimethylformamidase beta subunit-like protein